MLKCGKQYVHGKKRNIQTITMTIEVQHDYQGVHGVKKLNSYLQDKSYIEGYGFSQADVDVFQQLSGAPSVDFPHALRWYKHIQSYNPPGVQKLSGGHSGDSCSKKEAHVAAVADDDVDLFASDDEEDAEAIKIREERVKAYSEKKSKKPELIAKSMVVLDVKPWDDETDMKRMKEAVISIQMDGLVWGASKLVPVGYGINKLQIVCVVEDVKVSIDELSEKIKDWEDFVQSVDVASFNKI